jgi:hypothetical protein
MSVVVPSRALLAGSSGPIGRALAGALARQGTAVARLVRRPPRAPEEFAWDPASGTIAAGAFDGVDAVFNLAGRSIAAGRWTAATRAAILESRIQATRALVDALAKDAPHPSRVLISASAIGYYGDRGEETLTEAAPAGRGFLATVAETWEREASRAGAHGVRVACARFGVVLAPHGGALAPMLPIFRLGLGGRLGSGRQWWSWVHIDDVAGALVAMARNPSIRGPVNVVAPAPARNRDFVRALADSVRRPALIPAPAVALKILLGRMADDLLLASIRVIPQQLRAHGFAFEWPELGAALQHVVTSRAGGTHGAPCW